MNIDKNIILNKLENIFNNIVCKYYYNEDINIDKNYSFYYYYENIDNFKNIEYLFINTILNYIDNLYKNYSIEIEYIIKINKNKLELEIINIKK